MGKIWHKFITLVATVALTLIVYHLMPQFIDGWVARIIVAIVCLSAVEVSFATWRRSRIRRRLAVRALRHEYGRRYRFVDWQTRQAAALRTSCGASVDIQLDTKDASISTAELRLRIANNERRFSALAPFAVDITVNGDRIGATPQEAQRLAELLGAGDNTGAFIHFNRTANRLGVGGIGTSVEIGIVAEMDK